MPKHTDFFDNIAKLSDTYLSNTYAFDPEQQYLSIPAPNIIEWTTSPEYWNMASTFKHVRQYQLLRDSFNLRCPFCNPMDPGSIDCWGKGRVYLEAETLLTWKEEHRDFVCPKCGNTQRELLSDGFFTPYNEFIVIAGMRSGKSFFGGIVGGYGHHFCITQGIKERGLLQRTLNQASSEWFELTFAASTATQAQDTIYAKYREMLNDSPWMNRYIEWVKKREKEQIGAGDKWTFRMKGDEIRDGYLKLRCNRVASDSSGIAGKTRVFAFLDELSRLNLTESKKSAKELYRVLNQSLQTVKSNTYNSQYMPYWMGTFTMVTSPISVDDLAMTIYSQTAQGERPQTFAAKYPSWQFNPQLTRESLQSEFDKDPVGAERDFGANPPLAATAFINDPLRFWKSIDWDKIPIASFKDVYFSDPTGKKYIGLQLDECIHDHMNNYYLMVDAGVSWDAFAIVCAHPEWVDIEGTPDPVPHAVQEEKSVPDGMMSVSQMGGTFVGQANHLLNNDSSRHQYEHQGKILRTVIDFAVRIVPTDDREVWFDSIVKLIDQLRKKIRVVTVAYDTWQSESSIQQIRSMGIQAFKCTLKTESFMSFLQLAYADRIRLLPPHPEDGVTLTETDGLRMARYQEHQHSESVALVELLKLSRSPDLRTIYNEHKGQVRGRDSDDLARCVIGVSHLVQDAYVDQLSNSGRKRELRKRALATGSDFVPMVAKGRLFNR